MKNKLTKAIMGVMATVMVIGSPLIAKAEVVTNKFDPSQVEVMLATGNKQDDPEKPVVMVGIKNKTDKYVAVITEYPGKKLGRGFWDETSNTAENSKLMYSLPQHSADIDIVAPGDFVDNQSRSFTTFEEDPYVDDKIELNYWVVTGIEEADVADGKLNIPLQNTITTAELQKTITLGRDTNVILGRENIVDLVEPEKTESATESTQSEPEKVENAIDNATDKVEVKGEEAKSNNKLLMGGIIGGIALLLVIALAIIAKKRK